jgi:hypothetical protein
MASRTGLAVGPQAAPTGISPLDRREVLARAVAAILAQAVGGRVPRQR